MLIAAGTSAAHHARIPIFGGTSADAHSYSRDGYATVGENDLTHPGAMKRLQASDGPI